MVETPKTPPKKRVAARKSTTPAPKKATGGVVKLTPEQVQAELLKLRMHAAMPLVIPVVPEDEPKETVSIVGARDDWYVRIAKQSFETEEQ